jgi:hypothetical protein
MFQKGSAVGEIGGQAENVKGNSFGREELLALDPVVGF